MRVRKKNLTLKSQNQQKHLGFEENGLTFFLRVSFFFPTLKFEGPTKKNSRLIKNEFDTKEPTRLGVGVGVTRPPLMEDGGAPIPTLAHA